MQYLSHSQFSTLPKQPRNWFPIWFSFMLIALIWMIRDLDLSFSNLILGLGNTFEYLSRYRSPDFSELPAYLALMGQTLAIALWGTCLAFIISFFLAPLAAKNLSPHPLLYQSTRELFNFMRAMPDLMLALLFVSAIGLGPLPGVLALAVHTAGFLGKFFAESMERVNPGVYEAMQATGASFLQVILFAALPSISQEIVGYTLYIFDRNVRMASVLGLVGAGGIGLALHENLRFFNYDKSAALILVILVTIVAIDYLSTFIRGKIA